MQHTMRAPRTISLFLSALLFVIALASSSHLRALAVVQSSSQSGASKSAPKRTTANKRAQTQKSQQEKRNAVAALNEVAEDARRIEDEYQRALLLARCADALWAADKEAARAIFRRAWEAAAASDVAEMKQAHETGDESGAHYFTDAREEILTTVARRDAHLAELFFQEMLKSQSEAGFDPARPALNSYDAGPSAGLSAAAWQRLQIAERLLAAGQPAAAAEIALSVTVEGANPDLLSFLFKLRLQSPKAADKIYLSLLERTRINAQATINDVLLLSSYPLTQLISVFDEHGSVEFRAVNNSATRNVDAPINSSPLVRSAFLETAAAVLLRPLPQTSADSNNLAENRARSLYFTIGRLLPFFEREAPQHVPALNARLSALAAEIEAKQRDALESQMKVQKLSSENSTDPLRPRLEEIERERDPARRDRARYSTAVDAARRRLWERAKRIVGEIENTELRDAARHIVGARQIVTLVEAFSDGEKDDIDRAAAFARQVELSPQLAPALRAYGLASIASLAAQKNERQRAVELLDEAVGYAQQIEVGTELRSATVLMTATIAARIDSRRGWEFVQTAVGALNNDAEFYGNAVQLNSESTKYSPAEQEILLEIFNQFTLDEMFAAIAAKDFNRALAEARMIKEETARALALIAVAQTLLSRNARELRKASEKK